MTIQVILVSGATAIKSGLLFDQPVRVIVDAVGFTPLIFDVSQQEPMMIITVAKLAAVRVDATSEQVKVVVILVTGFPPLFVNETCDLVVRIVLIMTRPVA